jgi:murein DD-endopeptidase MepM/ murein hydrolase activator NlpD
MNAGVGNMNRRTTAVAMATPGSPRLGAGGPTPWRSAVRRYRYLLAVLTVAGLMGSGAPSLLSAAPAHADASATVKVKTQRMSDANLSSPQNGWYNPGDQLTLVCSRRGQNVKGFFSFNIPGGWDNLWYKTSDGSFVADVDIETGTLNNVAKDCDAGGTAPVASSSGLRWPLDSVSVFQGWGADPAFYSQFGQNGHNGLDLVAPSGTLVYAASDGTIDFEGFGEGHPWMLKPAGICILLKGNDVYTGYAHLSKTVIDKGQHVSKGQLIGYSGATGVASGPHLHFEVLPLNPDFKNGFAGRVDPTPYLP